MCLTPPTEGFPWDNLCIILRGCQKAAKVPNIAENYNRLSRVHERYKRQMTDRQTDDDISLKTESESECSYESKMNFVYQSFQISSYIIQAEERQTYRQKPRKLLPHCFVGDNYRQDETEKPRHYCRQSEHVEHRLQQRVSCRWGHPAPTEPQTQTQRLLVTAEYRSTDGHRTHHDKPINRIQNTDVSTVLEQRHISESITKCS